MSEQNQSFMQILDQWTEATVINPLHDAVIEGNGDDCNAVCAQIKKAIRAKILESYRNGQNAGVAPKAKVQTQAGKERR